ncbi:MAG: glycosyltransferase family 2 protein [Chthoniobacterales bacterium]
MRISIVIICWNDAAYIIDCIDSIYQHTRKTAFDIIVTDNGSTDGSLEMIRNRFPEVRTIESSINAGFGGGNNAGFRTVSGDYVLILNPDTIIHDGAIDKLVAFAETHPEAGAFGCRVLNPDGSLQETAQPAPTIGGYLIAALGLRALGRVSDFFLSDTYPGWDGRRERPIGFSAACMLLVRTDLLKRLDGFDTRFPHQFEDADLCLRIWQSGFSVLFCPEAEITHIGGHRRGGYPLEVLLQTERSKYRYFHKHFGLTGAIQIRRVSLIGYGLRYLAHRIQVGLSPSRELQRRVEIERNMLDWHRRFDPAKFAQSGEEPPMPMRDHSACYRTTGNVV